jgi:hypothetical protein
MKQCSADGVSIKSKMPVKEGITEEEEGIFWNKHLLGCHTSASLLYTVYFYNGKLFGLRSQEHRNLRYVNFKIESNCIIFDESISKTYHGGLKDLKYTPCVVKHVCCGENEDVGHFRCLVHCYTKYLGSIEALSKEIEAFYFKPHVNGHVIRFQRSPVGVNTLNKILPEKLCGGAGIKRKTSHSLRITCATRLFQESVEEGLIRERTGHRSDALFRYERKSEEQEIRVSSILGPPRGGIEEAISNVPGSCDDLSSDVFQKFTCDVSDEALCTVPMPGDENKSGCNPAIAFPGCVFNNCKFNF